MKNFGFLRVAAVSPDVVVGDVEQNVLNICQCIDELKQKGVQIAVFPELCITGYTCADLFEQTLLLESAKNALTGILAHTQGIAVFVGLPLRSFSGSLYNVAALLSNAEKILIYPKTFIPNYGEFYEKRWFTPFEASCGCNEQMFDWPVGGLLKINDDSGFTGAVLAAEVCEDAWVPLSPSTVFCLNGANVIVNLSAGNEVIGKASYRKDLILGNSAKNVCAYVYANAGMGESTQDLVFSGHSLIAENGSLLAEKKPFDEKSKFIISDIDIEKINHERIRMETFSQNSSFFKNSQSSNQALPAKFQEITVKSTDFLKNENLERKIDGHPFVPQVQEKMWARCAEITQMQAWGLAKRIRHTGVEKVVVGISGGLDSTLALLVACRAFDILKKERSNIVGITMPGFGTTGRTYENAKMLVKSCGASLEEISIKEAASGHLKDLSHALDVYDVTYENAQARERTQVLFDWANMHGAILIGTGDLSELALGWCTYNGDQMSNYGVNNSIPKTLVRCLVQYYADFVFKENEKLAETLNDIIDTPVSPELLPPDKDGKIAQKTENTVGSYILHDFFLYNCVRNGFSPEKIYFLAKIAVKQKNLEPFSDETIKNTLRIFYKRFFGQQFKRSCMPDGVKVGTVSLSPRGDWRMPSDSSVALWLKQVENLK
ncbi:NAD(+) synthase [uncultured Treponema sp.]|uniref:NAD(+) synthase n=1 Tax=uncultured Treponema sp. TaxID=162155 RepID=UPI0025947970|nr:NAD(+) synthase [uncultured Treponema sp.]